MSALMYSIIHWLVLHTILFGVLLTIVRVWTWLDGGSIRNYLIDKRKREENNRQS